MPQCQRCQSHACDGRTATCLGCATTQCHGNGLGKGSCSVCLFGILPGWSGWIQTCGYKGCELQAAFHDVPGSVKRVCHYHATRPKISAFNVKVTLAEYVTRLLTQAWRARGVVRPDEQHTPWPLFLSEAKESAYVQVLDVARNSYRPLTQPEVK